MKKLFFICFLFPCLSPAAQNLQTYTDLLKFTDEVYVSDSLHINAAPRQKNLLDSLSVKKWFSPVLGTARNNRLKNRNYYMAGKITTNTNFDLLVLLEEKKRSDSTSMQVAYLITTKKDGTYIASIEAAVAGIRRKSSYNTTSWLYKDYKITLDSKIKVNQTSFDDMTSYKINGSGRFILSANYE